MEFRHAVYAVTAHHSQTGHVYLAVPEDGHFFRFIFFPGKTLAHQFQPPLVNFIYNQENPGQQFLEHGNRPALQCFRHNRMIGIGYRIRGNAPGILPVHPFLIHKDAHQFRNNKGRMGVIDVEGNIFIKILR